MVFDFLKMFSLKFFDRVVMDGRPRYVNRCHKPFSSAQKMILGFKFQIDSSLSHSIILKRGINMSKLNIYFKKSNRFDSPWLNVRSSVFLKNDKDG